MICKTHTKWYFVFLGRTSDYILWLDGMANSTDKFICLSSYRFIERGGHDLASCFCWSSQGTLQAAIHCPSRGENPGPEQLRNLPKDTPLERTRSGSGPHNNQESETLLITVFLPHMTLCTDFAYVNPTNICPFVLSFHILGQRGPSTHQSHKAVQPDLTEASSLSHSSAPTLSPPNHRHHHHHHHEHRFQYPNIDLIRKRHFFRKR